jgi:SPP1 family predicted phage head-tail adaptor
MNAGNLDELVLLQRATQTKSATTGEVVETWETIDSFWAQIKYNESGSEVNAGMQSQFKQRATFKIRWHSDTRIDDRIYFNSESYKILAITDIDRRMYMIIDTEKTQ